MISVGKSGCHSKSYSYSWSVSNRILPTPWENNTPPIPTPHLRVRHLLTSCSHIWHTEGDICTCSICQDAFYYPCITHKKFNLIAKRYLPFETSDTCTKRSSMLCLSVCHPWNHWHTYQLWFPVYWAPASWDLWNTNQMITFSSSLQSFSNAPVMIHTTWV